MAIIKTKYSVEGMSCAACASSIERELSKKEGIIKATVNLLANTLVVEYYDSITDKEIVDTIKRIGYTLLPYKGNKVEKDLNFNKKRNKLIISSILTIILIFIVMGNMQNHLKI